MKIAFICGGDIPVPPPSWGAVELLVWELSENLRDLDVEVDIFASKDLFWVKSELIKNNYDFIHLHNEDYLPFFEEFKSKKFIVTGHCGWADNIEHYEPYYWKTFKSIINGSHYIFASSEKIKQNYVKFGFDQNKIFVTKNGVDNSKYRFTTTPLYPDRSIFLGRIERRKRQYVLSDKELNIDFAGFGENLTLSKTNKYIGIWSKKDVSQKLTDYANLILLSISEAHPLVCMEALSSGVGLVLSENSAVNLDINKKFISIIPENKMNDFEYIEKIILENRNYSLNNREHIVEYAKEFDWKKVSLNYKNLLDRLV